jgi:hypothetical protein
MAASLHLASYSFRDTGRMLRAMRSHRRRIEAAPGAKAARLFFTAELDRTFGGAPTPTRWAFFCGWETTDARDDFLGRPEAMAPFTAGAREHWRVSLDTARVVQGDWRGWEPSAADTAPLEPGEPLAVITYGHMNARYMPAFTWHNRRIVRAFTGNEGLVKMIGLGDHPMVRATFSLWRSKSDVVRTAYGADTVHDPVQRRSLAAPWAHHYFFARFRPVASTGTWDGSDPLAGLSAREHAT